MPSIAIIGDRNPSFPPHLATEEALLAAAPDSSPIWLPTMALANKFQVKEQLSSVDGLLIAPGSPYQSMEGALHAIRYARETAKPLLATCGGFQHVVIEYARNVLGFEDADHEEYLPPDEYPRTLAEYAICASRLFIRQLSCSLVGKTMQVQLADGSRARALYGAAETTEHYYCNFGLNPLHQQQLHDGGLKVSGIDQDGECRILEIPSHRFFIATLFLPQMSAGRLPSLADPVHPLLREFCAAIVAAH